MSRRRQTEVQFGSDSFLDVIANIVGILIILIVITGLRVSKIPFRAMPEDVFGSDEIAEETPLPYSVPDLPDLPESKDPPTPAVIVMQPVQEEPEEETPEPEAPPLPLLVAPKELVDLAKQLESEIGSLQDQQGTMSGRMALSKEQYSELMERQKAIRDQMAEKKQLIEASRKQTALVEADIVLAKETLARLQKQVEEIEAEPGHVETLEHRITPISRVVNGTEKHYRLEKNRVLEVPLEELCSRFREQIDRRRDWLAKTRQHQGQIGPIKGFSMHYVVHVESMSDIDSMRAGHGGFRVSLGKWEIIPEPDARGETAEVALKRGSLFYQSILGTSSDTTLTFWVYPDSYALYRRLQKFTHDHGYSVAARPLPDGVPIAGSPNGSKSASQ